MPEAVAGIADAEEAADLTALGPEGHIPRSATLRILGYAPSFANGILTLSIS